MNSLSSQVFQNHKGLREQEKQPNFYGHESSNLSYGDQYDLSPDPSIYSPSNSPDSDSDNDDNSDSELSDFDFQSLTVFYTNADQFLNKRDELQMFIAGNEPDIILISEILPKSHCNTQDYRWMVTICFLILILMDVSQPPAFVVWAYMFRRE